MKNSTLTIVSVILVIVVCLVLWKDEIFKTKVKPPVSVEQSTYNQRIIITNKQTGDTIFDKNLKSLSPMELDSLTLYLNTRK